MENAIFESYLEARRRGKARAISKSNKYIVLPPKVVTPAPVIYFHDALDEDGAYWMGGELADEIGEKISSVTPPPPFPEVYYEFRHNNRERLLHILYDGDLLTIRNWTLDPDFSWRLWQYNFRKRLADQNLLVFSPVNWIVEGDQSLLDRVHKLLHTNLLRYSALTLLMGHSSAQRITEERPIEPSLKAKLPRKPTCTIKPIIIRVGPTEGIGREGAHTPKAPHDRRGHLRTYASGRQIWIEASRIKGGATEAREYYVEPKF